jgi:hypothetical protein
MQPPIVNKRGRPKAETEGAREAIAEIERKMKRENLSCTRLALALQMNTSSVTRALNQGDPPGWTPSLKRIYRIAIKGDGAALKITPGREEATLQRLLKTPPAAAGAVRAILNDVQRLVEALSAPQRSEKRKHR